MRSNVGFNPFLNDSLLAKCEVLVDELKVFFSLLFSEHFFHCDKYFAFLSHFLLLWTEFYIFLLFFFNFFGWFLNFLQRNFLFTLFLHLLWMFSFSFMIFMVFRSLITSEIIFLELFEFIIVKFNNFLFIKLLKNLSYIHIRIFFNIRWSLFNWNV